MGGVDDGEQDIAREVLEDNVVDSCLDIEERSQTMIQFGLSEMELVMDPFFVCK